MKRGTFRRVNFTIEHTNSYGRYLIKAIYRGQDINVATTDSEAWDWLDDDSNLEKYNDARRHCYNKIRQAYEN